MKAIQLSANMERNDSLLRVLNDMQTGIKPLAAIRREQDRLRDLRIKLYNEAVKPTTYSTVASLKGATA